MRIFVRSRGRSLSLDYQWHEASATGDLVIDSGIPELLASARLSKFMLADVERLVIFRSGNAVGLLVGGIASGKRRDELGRAVQDSLLFDATSESEENLLRSVAARVLREPDWLRECLDNVVQFHDSTRFCTSWTDIRQLVDSQSSGLSGLRPDERSFTRRLTPETRESLGDELLHFDLPRSGSGALVWVGLIGSLKESESSGVWRGLCPGIGSERDWEVRRADRSGQHDPIRRARDILNWPRSILGAVLDLLRWPRRWLSQLSGLRWVRISACMR